MDEATLPQPPALEGERGQRTPRAEQVPWGGGAAGALRRPSPVLQLRERRREEALAEGPGSEHVLTNHAC